MPARKSRLREWLMVEGALAVVFIWPLSRLVHFAFTNGAYSHIMLVPFVSAYLAWNRRGLPLPAAGHRALPAAFFGGFAVILLLAYGWAALLRVPLNAPDSLALTTGAYLLMAAALCAWCLGAATLRRFAFAIGFLVFMVPMPTWLTRTVETVLQYGSAEAAQAFFRLAGTPVFRDDLVFQLPGISLAIAPECSGIRSTLVLFMISLIAGHLFLRSPWKRGILVIAVLPFAFLRNGFRVFTIGELCVHVSPKMIDSPIHRFGGPLFFMLILIPFCVLLFLLVKSERVPARR
jgi:exosortase C (VPDSG-CTERM-specific)